MEIPLLRDIIVIFVLALAVMLLFSRLKLPPIVGFLITGIIGGPGGLGLVQQVENVEILSKIGIVLLLFTVGLEFSLKKILEFKRYFFIGGALQVGLTVLSGFLIAKFLNRPAGESIFLGFLLSLSSTAIVLKVLQDKSQSLTPHGKAVIGILIFQDVAAIPMMLLTPLLGGETLQLDIQFAARILGGLTFLVVIFFLASNLVPKILDKITRLHSKELFLLSVIAICSTVAYLASSIGLTLSLGAFLAGLVISDSEYSLEAIGDILPFRDIFTSFFFVSVGMLLNVNFVLHNPLTIFLLTIGVLLLKGTIGTFAVMCVGMPLRPALLTGLAISQVGEFSFVLAKSGIQEGLGTPFFHQIFLDMSVLTMMLSPYIINFSESFANWILKLPIPLKLKMGFGKHESAEKIVHKDHVIIIGYGISGQNIARSSAHGEIPYVVIEMNSETVRREKKKGVPIFFGDASHETVLKHAGIEHAKAIAVVINDTVAALRIVEKARKINPSIYIIARVPRVHEMEKFYKLGATEVIPDEFGTSVEIFTRVLKLFHITTEEIERLVDSFRSEGYELLRTYFKDPESIKDLRKELTDIKMKTFKVSSSSQIAHKTVLESDIRKKHNVTLMLIKRGEETLNTITGDTIFLPEDRIVLIGTKENLNQAAPLF